MLLGPRTKGDGEIGYFSITPFKCENGLKVVFIANFKELQFL